MGQGLASRFNGIEAQPSGEAAQVLNTTDEEILAEFQASGDAATLGRASAH